MTAAFHQSRNLRVQADTTAAMILASTLSEVKQRKQNLNFMQNLKRLAPIQCLLKTR